MNAVKLILVLCLVKASVAPAPTGPTPKPTIRPTPKTTTKPIRPPTQKPTTPNGPSSLDCREFTYDRCDFGKLTDLVSTTFGEDDSYCQFICTFLQSDDCKYWVYDYPNQKCDIYGSDSDPDFGSICHNHAGPSLPTIDDCKTNENKCRVSKNLLRPYFSGM